MSVKLRLTRVGKKKKPFYRIVAADSRSPRDGRFIEVVASYSPNRDPEVMGLDEERVCYWLDNGAVMTERVRGILKQEGVLARWEKAKSPEMETEAPASEASEKKVAEETPVPEEAEEAVVEEVLSTPEEPVEEKVKASKPVKSKPKTAAPKKKKEAEVSEETV
ncbi:MAG: 30S ribosomal protein S16, partial [Candidatus Latescibacteria bacterium]|nr:30S ribosomal protein S16 [Candidatus Latescibacterota bacterium]